MPQLDPTWFASQLFWLFVTFVLLYFVLSKLVLPPLMDIIALRKDTIASDLDAAQSLQKQAEDAKAQYERALAEARERSQAVMNEAMQAHKQQSEAAFKEMDAKITAKISEAEQRIGAKKQELIAALDPVSRELGEAIVKQISREGTEAEPGNANASLAKGNG